MFESIKKNDDFLKVYHNGKSYANRYLVMYLLKTGEDYNRFGITVSKKVGNSVVRHRVKRLIKESIRLNMDFVKNGYDIVIVSKKSAKGLNYAPIESAYLHLCKLHHILIDRE